MAKFMQGVGIFHCKIEMGGGDFIQRRLTQVSLTFQLATVDDL